MEANLQKLIHPMPWPISLTNIYFLKQCALIYKHYIQKHQEQWSHHCMSQKN